MDVAVGDEDKVLNTALLPLKLTYGLEPGHPIALNLGTIVASNKGSCLAKVARLIPHFRYFFCFVLLIICRECILVISYTFKVVIQVHCQTAKWKHGRSRCPSWLPCLDDPR